MHISTMKATRHTKKDLETMRHNYMKNSKVVVILLTKMEKTLKLSIASGSSIPLAAHLSETL